MIYIEAPNTTSSSKKSLFLAGSISETSNWQQNVIKEIELLDIVVFNPRRKNFDVDDPTAVEKQITWEFMHLRAADAISFWFAKETLGPIVLFELGAHMMTSKPIVVGIDPDYERKKDVEIQAKLVRPDIKIVYSLEKLSKEIFSLFNEIQKV